jgi:hypothetical protein
MKKSVNDSPLEQLEEAFTILRTSLQRYDVSKARPVLLAGATAISVERLCQKFVMELKTDLFRLESLSSFVYDSEKMAELLEEYAKKKHKFTGAPVSIEVPEHYSELTLNLDQSHIGRDLRFFMTTKEEVISEVAGNVYLRVMGMKDDAALSVARKVVPQYLPRSKPGVTKVRNIGKEEVDVFNSYIPPEWMSYDKPLPDRLPKLFERLVNHLFPLKIEREYFYAWLYASLFNRAFVYLILCGPGGTGKNRLKLVLRALHGHQNTVDGKRSTLIERFNSQLADSTLAWFDELTYDQEMENFMKEVQNDSISIERKGVDATRSTKIYASLAISNNKPRDNYIAFDARKFVPLQIGRARLDTVMTPEEIEELTGKVETWNSPTYDIAFLAQIGRWIKKHGRSNRWSHLEYKGPMFYKLAHTSMSRWQKKAASIIIEGVGLNNSRIVEDREKGFLWSTVAEQSQKKNGDRSLQFPDFTTVKHFFEIFVDGKGRPTFKTTNVPGNIMGDFYVRLINKNASILTESEVNQAVTGDEDGQSEETGEEYDL